MNLQFLLVTKLTLPMFSLIYILVSNRDCYNEKCLGSSVWATFICDHDDLRYFEVTIKDPPKQDPRLSLGPRRASALGGAYTPLV